MAIKLPKTNKSRNPLFSKLLVKNTMRYQVISLAQSKQIADVIRIFVKFKVDAVLVVDEKGLPAGVVTKTEITGTYYAAMPLDTQLSDIMGSPVIHCSPEDSLESALVTMQEARIHRIYVVDEASHAIGTLSYPDIVGTLYKYCCDCEFSLRKKGEQESATRLRYTIKDVMRAEIVTASAQDSIMEVIEKISSYHLGALLIIDSSGKPAGVISKTDLALAYVRDISVESTAETIMRTPVSICRGDLPLEEGIRQMIFAEISRLFVCNNDENEIIGVLSLSDAARIRSGSCQACSSSRIKVKE